MINFFENVAETFGIKPETVFTVSTTISIFFLGFIVNHCLNVRVAYLARKTTRRIILLNLSKLIEQVDGQSNNFHKIDSQLVMESNINTIFEDVIIPSIDVLEKIGYESCYKAFFSGIENKTNNLERLEAFTSLWNLLMYFKEIQSTTLRLYEQFISKYNEIDEKRNMLSGQIQSKIDEIISSSSQNPHISSELGEFLLAMGVILKETNNTENYTMPINLYQYHVKLSNLYKANVPLVRKYEVDLKSNDLMSMIREVCYRYKNLENLVLTTKSTYQDLFISYREKHNELEAIRQRL